MTARGDLIRGERERVAVALRVNGRAYQALVEPRRLLVDFLREDCGLTGTHVGCEHGVCGACTVLMGGRTVRSCLLFAVQANGEELLTVEGLAQTDAFPPLEEGFRRHHGLQCGFCTPGMLASAHELLRENPDPSEDAIREALAGNLCRCTGYAPIVRAVQSAAARLRGTASRAEGEAHGGITVSGAGD